MGHSSLLAQWRRTGEHNPESSYRGGSFFHPLDRSSREKCSIFGYIYTERSVGRGHGESLLCNRRKIGVIVALSHVSTQLPLLPDPVPSALCQSAFVGYLL